MRSTFESSGEVGRDLLAVDWGSTAVGDPETWPHSLRTVVRLVLASRFSMWMAWGPELTFFCNDAYRRDTLGEKYPWALGKPASEVWSEIWHDIGPRIDSVLSTGEATWDEQLMLFLERSGFTEETYHTFSYSPVADDDGRINGMLCVVSEDTGAVVAGRRMQTLRDLGARPTAELSQAQTVGSACASLATNGRDLPFVLCYLYDEAGDLATLATTAGLAAGDPGVARLLRRGDPDLPWPMPDQHDRGVALVEDLHERLPHLPSGAWDEPPTLAAVVPLPPTTPGPPYGFLVVGVNPYRPWDAGYADFLELVAGQVAADITDARAFEFEKARAEGLAALDRAKTEFFTNISHEFRTPLTLLLGPAEDALADRDAALPDPQRQRVEVIHRNGQRLLKLVNTLLDFSRLESGRAEIAFEPVDLAAYTRELAAMFESAASRLGLSLVADCPPLPEPVHVDRDAWGKVVLNLLSNALKFTFEGGVRVSLRASGPYAELEVSDTGTGIPLEDQAQVFERFQRVSGARSRNHEGSGIGLALVAELAALHGGEVSVTSVPGEGSAFRVRVPFGTEHLDPERLTTTATRGAAPEVLAGFLHEAEQLRPAPSRSAQSRTGTGRPRVLVVDDNADVRDYVAQVLSAEYDVSTAEDGEDGLAQALAAPPGLVLTDVMMPRLDGFGLLAALREDERTRDVPVVMLSARAGEDGTIEGLEAGADDYLAKPFAARELLARVGANLELDRSKRVRDQLERSRALMDQAQRLAGVGSWEVDVPSGTVRASDEFCRIVGITQADVAELRYPTLIDHLIHPDDRPAVHAALAGSAAGDVRYEVRVLRPSGEEATVSVHAEIETDEHGAPAVIRGSLQDVTERKEAERVLAEARAAQEAAAREHAIADSLQRSLLPVRSFDLEDIDVATYYRAGVEGTQVGGDWYDVIELGAGRTALVIGDVMGRGVRAAAVMGQLRAAIRAYARLDLPPADLLEHLDGLVRELGPDQIVSCVYAVFDPADLVLRYANAGHLPPVLIGPDGTVTLMPETQDPPLGVDGGRLDQAEVPMPAGSTVVLYTDGLVERRGEDLEHGILALRDLCRELEVPLAEVPDALVARRLGEGLDDDVAILAARVGSARVLSVRTLELRPEDHASARARALVTSHLAELGVTDRPVVDDAVLVASELVTNAVLHAELPCQLRLVSTRDELRIEVEDRAHAQPQRRRPDDDDEHGRGLTIVAALSSGWGSRPTPTGKVVWGVVRTAPTL